MKTKIVYCLVSNEKDYYYEQLLISLASLRKYNPDAEVEVVCDGDTFKSLRGSRSTVNNYNVKITCVDTPKDWDNCGRSRYLKTNLRRFIKGDYLYIDTDTIICDSLDIVDSFTCNLGAVYDSHVLHPIPRKPMLQNEKWICREADKAGVVINGLTHFNSGVFYVKDETINYELYQKWGEKYKEFYEKGSRADQLSLMLANKELGEIITPMAPVFNCHVIKSASIELLPRAIVIHYFPGHDYFILSSPWLLDPIKETGEISITVRRIIDNPQDFFKQRSKIIFGNSVDELFSGFVQTYFWSPKLLKMFVHVSEYYIKLKKIVRKIIKLPLEFFKK